MGSAKAKPFVKDWKELEMDITKTSLFEDT